MCPSIHAAIDSFLFERHATNFLFTVGLSGCCYLIILHARLQILNI